MARTATNPYRAVVFAVALASGGVYWSFADWWAYVEFPDGPMPKFIMPWWFQALVSGTVGLLTGGVAAGVLWVWSRTVGDRTSCA